MFRLVCMNPDTLMQEWKLITGLLPVEWELLARTTGAFSRSRNVRDPSVLLQLVLLHAAAGLSLRQSAVRASCAGVASISDVGLLKRIRKSRKWLHELTVRMFSASPFRAATEVLPPGRLLRVVDETKISEPGRTGTEWRMD